MSWKLKHKADTMVSTEIIILMFKMTSPLLRFLLNRCAETMKE